MPNDFHVMRVYNRLGNASYHVQLQIQRDDATNVDPGPKRNEDGSYTLPIVQPMDDARHIVLGKFMDEWSKLEMALSHLLSNVTSTPWESVSVLMNALGSRGQLDVLRTLAPIKIKSDDLETLFSLLDRVKANNTKRNNIVHGYWMLELLVIDRGGLPEIRYRQFREYAPSDMTLKQQITDPANRKVRSKYLFSIARINAISREVSRLCADVQKFNSRCFRSGKQPVEQPVNVTVGEPIGR